MDVAQDISPERRQCSRIVGIERDLNTAAHDRDSADWTSTSDTERHFGARSVRASSEAQSDEQDDTRDQQERLGDGRDELACNAPAHVRILAQNHEEVRLKFNSPAFGCVDLTAEPTEGIGQVVANLDALGLERHLMQHYDVAPQHGRMPSDRWLSWLHEDGVRGVALHPRRRVRVLQKRDEPR
jgi:hypothetical protein